MKVRLLTSLAGDRFSYQHGDIVELDDAEAARFIERELAEVIEEDAEDAPKKSRKTKD